MRSQPFARARALMSVIMSAMAAGQFIATSPAYHYQSRGKGEGCIGNKHAKSSFKQNKRRGL
jgi:hypothetical protein